MTSVVFAQASTKLFYKNIPGYEPPVPEYETYIDENGEEKKRERDTPVGLSARDTQILENVRRNAHWLDKDFSVCGFFFGWGLIITLIPGIGAFLTLFLDYWLIVAQARKAELPNWLQGAMLVNLGICFACGMVPILGGVAAYIFGCNKRNVALFEEYLAIRGVEHLRAEGDRRYDPEVIKPGAGFSANDRTLTPAVPDKQPLISSEKEQNGTGVGRAGVGMAFNRRTGTNRGQMI